MLGAAVIATLIAASCGGDDDSSDATDPDPAATAATKTGTDGTADIDRDGTLRFGATTPEMERLYELSSPPVTTPNAKRSSTTPTRSSSTRSSTST